MSIIGFDTNNKTIMGNAIGGLVFQFLIRLKGVFILPLIVHFLSVENIADWRIISTTVSLLLPLLTLNILDGSGMFFSSDFEKNSVSEKFNSVLNVSFLILLIGTVPLYFILINSDTLSSLTYLIITNVFVSYLFKISVFIPQVYQKTKKLLIVNFITEYGSALITVLLMYSNWVSLYTLIYPIFVVNILSSIWLLSIIFREIKFRLFFIKKEFVVKSLRISIPLIPVFFTEWIIASISIYFISYYHNKNMVAGFSIALSIATLILTLKATLQYFWFSTCSNLLINNKMEEFNKFYSLIFRSFSLVIILGTFFYLFFVNDLVLVLSSKNYLYLNYPIIIISIGYGFLILSSLLNGILYSLTKTKEIMWIYLISAIIGIVINFLLIPKYGLIGASISTLIGNICLYFGMDIVVKRIIKLPKINNYFTFLSIVILLFFSGLLLRINNTEPNFLRLIGLIYILFCVFVSYKLKIIPNEIVQGINNYINRKWI